MSYFDSEMNDDNSDNESDKKGKGSDSEEDEDEDDNQSIEKGEQSGSENMDETDDDDIDDDDDDSQNVGKGLEEDFSDDDDLALNKNLDEDEENLEIDIEPEKAPSKKLKKIPNKQKIEVHDEEDDESDEDDDPSGDLYLKKFDKEINQNYLSDIHPECTSLNYDEILAMTKIVRDKSGIIIDELHKTIPYLTKYERARILGQRAKQINSGGTTFVQVPEKIIDGYLIAELELHEKRIPFIIRRPLPNGGSEYWCVKDLENIAF
jgi:DNA-directed RNA polymerase I, II, and III subunit RPABC2